MAIVNPHVLVMFWFPKHGDKKLWQRKFRNVGESQFLLLFQKHQLDTLEKEGSHEKALWMLFRFLCLHIKLWRIKITETDGFNNYVIQNQICLLHCLRHRIITM